MKNKNRRGTVGIAVSGGGMKTISLLGVFKAFIEKDVKIDQIVCTGTGSIIGAAIALGIPIADITEWLKKHANKKILRLKNLHLSGTYLFDIPEFDQALLELFGNKTFRDTLIPLKICSLDIISGKDYNFEKGKIHTAIRAAIVLPGVLEPIKHRGAMLVDSSIVHSVPTYELKEDIDIKIGIAMEYKDTTNSFKRIYKSYDQGVIPKSKKRLSLHEYIFFSNFVVIPSLVQRAYAILLKKVKHEYRKKYICDSYIKVPTQEVPYLNLRDELDVDKIIAIGERVIKRHIPEIKSKLNKIENNTYVQTCNIHS